MWLLKTRVAWLLSLRSHPEPSLILRQQHALEPCRRRAGPRGLDVSAHFGEGTPPVQGVNSFGHLGYGPPCPPPGDDPYHYAFRLYALDTPLDLGEGVTKRQLTDAMDGHILAEADHMGTYQRRA